MKKKLLAALLASTMAVTLLAGCGGSSSSEDTDTTETAEETETEEVEETEETEEAEDSAEAEDESFSAELDGTGLKIAVFIAQNSNEITKNIGEGAQEYGESIGAEVTVFDATYDQDTQVSQMETCITQGYDALIVEPVSAEGIANVAASAVESGIPVFTVMQDSSDASSITAHIGADHTDASVIEMEAICEALGGEGKIAILDGTMGSTGQIQITEGFDQALANYPDIEVVEEQSANYLIDEALEISETWLQKYDDLDAIVAQNDAMALGAAQACQDAGVELLIGGRDCSSDMREALENGTVYCTIDQGAAEMGVKAVEFAVTVINGGTVDEVYYTTNTLVTADNVADFN